MMTFNEFQKEYATPEHHAVYVAKNGAHVAVRPVFCWIQAEFDLNWDVNPVILTTSYGDNSCSL